jgi:arsenate reductase
MAEALARIDYGDLLVPFSAGSRPAGFVHPLAIRAIEELGFALRGAHSKAAEEFIDKPFDLVVTVCDSAAADCPVWPNARHLIHWSIEDPSFGRGDELTRLRAFRETRDELRGRIDGLMEALRTSIPRLTDHELLEAGVGILSDVLRSHGFKFSEERTERSASRRSAAGAFRRRGRALELEVRSRVAIVTYVAGEHRLIHPAYMELLGVADRMRFPGFSKDPLEAFRRLRADLARSALPFLDGSGLKDFRRFAEPTRLATRSS